MYGFSGEKWLRITCLNAIMDSFIALELHVLDYKWIPCSLEILTKSLEKKRTIFPALFSNILFSVVGIPSAQYERLKRQSDKLIREKMWVEDFLHFI